MKWTTIGWHFCLILLTLPALAQTPDTTSAERYHPLQIGNAWEYHDWRQDCGGESCETDVSLLRREVVGVEEVGGTEYWRMEEQRFTQEGDPAGPATIWLVRFALGEAHAVYLGTTETEFPWPLLGYDCRLDLPFGYAGPCDGDDGPFTEVTGPNMATLGEHELVTKLFFDGEVCATWFATDVGLYRVSCMFGGIYQQDFALRYALIDGVAYGTPAFPVVIEDAPSASGLALAVYPNPTRNVATARLTLDVPQRVTLAVFDVLGRRVHTADLGVQPAGETAHRLGLAALPAGLYVVRLAGDAGATAVTRIVRQ